MEGKKGEGGREDETNEGKNEEREGGELERDRRKDMDECKEKEGPWLHCVVSSMRHNSC